KLSTFAFFVKNVIRQRGLQRLAGRVHLLGTGIALPWKDFAAAQLATAEIVEDLKLGQELAEAGRPPRFIEGATISSNAETERNTLAQRCTWRGRCRFTWDSRGMGPPRIGSARTGARSSGTVDPAARLSKRAAC